MEFMDLVTSSDVLSSDKNIRDGSLPSLSLQFILKLRTLFMLVKFDGRVLLAQLIEQSLGPFAISTRNALVYRN
jgi:hypothetical protein